jgi:hypothetical protein
MVCDLTGGLLRLTVYAGSFAEAVCIVCGHRVPGNEIKDE